MGIKLKTTILGLAALAMTACSSGGGGGSSGGGSTASTLTLSGTLATRAGKVTTRNSAFSVSLTDLEFYAICLGETPDIDSSDVASDGTFSVTLTCDEGSAVTALFRDKTSLATVGQVVFEDSTDKDLDGNASQTSSVVLKSNVSFGNITLGDDGKVVIPVSTIAAHIDDTPVSSSNAFNFNGVWQFSAVPTANLPTGGGYTTTYSGCDMDTGVGCDHPGIPTGMKISFLRLAGKDFTPGAGCTLADTGGGNFTGACTHSAGGTTGTEAKFAISVWQGPATGASSGINACGNKTNFTEDEARAFGHIDLDGFSPTLDGNAISYGRISYAAMSGFGGDTCVDDATYCGKDWHKDNATANWDIFDCQVRTVTGTDSKSYSVRYCKATADWDVDDNGSIGGGETGEEIYNGFVEGNGGGCLDSNSKPLMVTNWANITPAGPGTNTAFPITGMHLYTQTYTNQDPDGSGPAAAQNFTCAFTNGNFYKSGMNFVALSNAQNSTVTNWQMATPIVTAGGACKDIATGNDPGLRLERYRCYANSYYGNGGGGSGCSKEWRFNWGATTADAFVVEEGRDKPKANFMTNIVKYSSDGGTMYVHNEDNKAIMVQSDGSNVVRCDIGTFTNIVMTKKTDSKMLFDIQEYTTLKSSDATCLAAANHKDSNGECLMGQGDEICRRLTESMKALAYANRLSN